MAHRYRLMPTAEQEAILREHCAHARFVWNLAWELCRSGTLETYGMASRRTRKDGSKYTHQKRRPVRPRPDYAEQCRQLTEARAESDWLRAGPQVVQQQALRDFDQAIWNFYRGTHNFPSPRRKKRRIEGFRIAGKRGRAWDVRRLNRNWGQVLIPKIGWVRFKWSRPVSPDAKSYRVTSDQAGRWHVAFAVIPAPIPAPGTGEVVGVDRGVAITAALSTGEVLRCPPPISQGKGALAQGSAPRMPGTAPLRS